MPLYALVCPTCAHPFEAESSVSGRYLIASPCCEAAPCPTDYQRLRIKGHRRFAGSEAVSLMQGFHPREVPEARREIGSAGGPQECVRSDGSVVFRDRGQERAYRRALARVSQRAERRREAAARRGADAG